MEKSNDFSGLGSTREHGIFMVNGDIFRILARRLLRILWDLASLRDIGGVFDNFGMRSGVSSKLARWSPRIVVVLLAISLSQAGSPALAGGICSRAAAEAEVAAGIPAQLLSAIAVAESGRYDAEKGETIAWPWTVYALGKGRYLPSKAAAIAEVERV